MVMCTNDIRPGFIEEGKVMSLRHTVCMVAWDIIPMPTDREPDARRRRIELKREILAYAKSQGLTLQIMSADGFGNEIWQLCSVGQDGRSTLLHNGELQGCCLKIIALEEQLPEG